MFYMLSINNQLELVKYANLEPIKTQLNNAIVLGRSIDHSRVYCIRQADIGVGVVDYTMTAEVLQ